MSGGRRGRAGGRERIHDDCLGISHGTDKGTVGTVCVWNPPLKRTDQSTDVSTDSHFEKYDPIGWKKVQI